MYHFRCLTLYPIIVQNENMRESASQSAARMSHQAAQKGRHITGRNITGDTLMNS